jgi:endonuclease/exonuclease/phosphatase family metal-dependent hydrolase
MQLRLLSWNIHKCIGGVDRRYDPDRVVATIGHYEPDVACLQEVDQLAKRSQGHRQVDVLGDRLGFRHRTWFANVKVRGGGEYGNAILAHHALTTTENIDLTVPLKKRRSVLHARYRVRLDHPGRGRAVTRTIHVFNMHLGLAGYERKRQLGKFLASKPFANLDHRTPVVVCGDFNDVWGTLGRLLEPSGFRSVAPIRTFPAYAPVRALDSVYVRGNVHLHQIQTARIQVARQASDHLPLIADLEVY